MEEHPQVEVSKPIHPPHSKASMQNFSRKTTARPRDSVLENDAPRPEDFLPESPPFRLRLYSEHPAVASKDSHDLCEGDDVLPLERVNSYSRIMYAHTEWQMKRATVLGYQRMMHEFTVNQLRHRENAARSAMASPQMKADQALRDGTSGPNRSRSVERDVPVRSTSTSTSDRDFAVERLRGGDIACGSGCCLK